MSDHAVDVTVVIPTFRRGDLLRDCIASCLAQEGLESVRHELLVVDNCPQRSAEPVVRAIARAAAVPVRYVGEPQGGISFARNTGLAAAAGRFVAFIDDDETASPRWLHHLLLTQAAQGADVVLAPVISQLPANASADGLFYQRFYTCTIDAPTGSVIGARVLTPPWARHGRIYPRLGSGNALIDRTSPRLADLRFDPRLAETGGEDTHFFTQALADGARIVWCAEAAAREAMPPSRLSASLLALRSFRGGQVTAWTPMLLRKPRPLMTAQAMATGAVQFALCAPRWLLHHMLGSRRRLALLEKSAAALGKLFWMAPFRRPAYGARAASPDDVVRARAVPVPADKPPPSIQPMLPLRLPLPLPLPLPRLSVLIPFYRDDPVPLARALLAQAKELSGEPDGVVEVVLFGDGSPDRDLAASIHRQIHALGPPVRLIVSDRNLGRAGARNALARSAWAPWVLFLDADMRVPPGFLARHLGAIAGGDFDAAFGGYAIEPPARSTLALHAALAAASEPGDAAARRRVGATAFCTSNLLVRADVAQAVPFDEGYVGWGWEDVDWAVSAARRFRLAHIDNPAGHAGWQEVDELLGKFRSASRNFGRLIAKHPELRRLPGARVAALLSKVPGQRWLRGMWASTARAGAMPLRLRVLALKLWRASWAAEAIP